MNLTNEQIAKVKEAKSVEELLAYAKEIGYELTEEEAKTFYGNLQKEGELADEELSNVAGGSTCVNGRYYSENYPYYLITTVGNSCDSYDYYARGGGPDNGTCLNCTQSYYVAEECARYCHARTRWSDPYNSDIGA